MGDIVCTLDDPLFVKGSHKDKTNVIMYEKKSAPVGKINHHNIIQGYTQGFGSKVGVYSNHATIMEAIKALFTKPEQEEQRQEIEKRKKLLREVVGAEIDSQKGLKKPKEPWHFTHTVKINEEDDDITKAEKYKQNSLVVKKKPYFFRYLYPELNIKYKQYESEYNEQSQSMFGIKLKKLLAKPNKTEEEKKFIRLYHYFNPLIPSDCIMNILCRQIEDIDFDIKYNKSNITMLPNFENEYEINQEILNQYRSMYRSYCNKKALKYLTEQISLDDEDYLEIKFGVTDALLDEIQMQWSKLGMNVMETLTYIHALAKTYSKFNWGFAYDLLGDKILSCLPDDKTMAPVEDADGQEYFGHKYILKNINKDNIDYEHLFDDDDEDIINEIVMGAEFDDDFDI